MRSLKGLVRPTHVAGQVRSAGARTSMVPILEPKDLQDRGTTAALKRRRPGHATATARLLSVWFGVGRHCGTAPPGWPAPLPERCSELQDATLFRREVADSHQKYTTKNRRLCPVEFSAVRAALVTTTRGSSECRPEEEAKSTSRAVALCGAKQEPQDFVADPQKPATTRAHSCGYQI